MAADEATAPIIMWWCDGGGVLQLMKLNEDWDQVYRSATLGLQHRLEALELENTAIKQLNSRLLLKVEHQQVNMQQYFKLAGSLNIFTWLMAPIQFRKVIDPEKWV